MFRSTWITRFVVTALAVMVFAPAAFGQGLLVNINPGEGVALPRPAIAIIVPPGDRPPPRIMPRPMPVPQQATYKIKEVSVQAKMVEQVARVQVSQSFVNTGPRQMEVVFMFPLPYDGAVDQLTLLVDGKEFAAQLVDAKEARKTYEDIVRKNQDPALLEWVGTGMFKTSVFPVPPGAERKVTLRYSQLCRKMDGATDFLFPLSTAKYTSAAVENVSFQLSIESQNDIKNVYSPTHSVEIKRPDNKHATIKYESKNEIPASDFRLLWDVGAGHVGATVLSYRPRETDLAALLSSKDPKAQRVADNDDGYFLMLASPEIKPDTQAQPRKTVIFVADRSGSMAGQKIEQSKNALKFVLNNLHQGDLFNVIAFDSEVESFKPELQKFNDETRKAALGFVEGIFAGGSTNIDGAMKAALSQFKDSKQPNFVLFMTDGIPTVGETNEGKIVANVKTNNGIRARVFAFGVGYDLNSHLLDKLVRDNYGLSEYVRPNEDIEARVAALYNRIGSPVMTDVAVNYDLEGVKLEDGQPVNRVYPREVRDLFAGEQMVIVGRYKKPGAAKVTISGTVGESQQKMDFPAQFVEASGDESFAFIEKLWAMRRIGEIIDQIDMHGKNDELVKELVGLATRHGILTPYTSFLADDRTNVRDLARNSDRAVHDFEMLKGKDADGAGGVAQRAFKSSLQNAGARGAADNALAPAIAAAGGGGGMGMGRGGAAPADPMAQAEAKTATGALRAPGQFGAPAASMPSAYLDKNDKLVVAQNIRQIGRKSFYLRGDQWIDSTVTEEQEKSVVKIERFSKEYFELIDKYGKDVAKYLANDEPIVVQLGGKAYAF